MTIPPVILENATVPKWDVFTIEHKQIGDICYIQEGIYPTGKSKPWRAYTGVFHSQLDNGESMYFSTLQEACNWLLHFVKF